MLLLIVFHMTACVHSSSSGRLCLCIENQFSHQDKRQKMGEKIGLGMEPTPAKFKTSAYTSGRLPDTAVLMIRDFVQTERRNLFSKLRDILGFRMTPSTEQPKGRCVWGLGLRCTFQTKHHRRRP